jgi:hypothetical protein
MKKKLMFTLTFTMLVLGSMGIRSVTKVSAHSGDVFGPACGVAVVDGQVNESEWASATMQTFQMIVPGTATPLTGTLRVMNGAYYLYYAFTINDDELSESGQWLPQGDVLKLVFDNDHSGSLFQVGDDVLDLSAGAPQFGDNYVVGTPAPSSNQEDTLGGGTSDGEGATQRINGLNHFEGKHPLCSGDTLDFCLHPGETAGFQIEYLDAEGDGSFGSSQFFPGPGNTSEADIVIGDCTIPDIFVFLPLIDKSP